MSAAERYRQNQVTVANPPVIPSNSTCRERRYPAPQGIVVSTGAHEKEQQTCERSRLAEALPRVEQQIEALAVDLHTAVPYDDPSVVWDAERSTRRRSVHRLPRRHVERVRNEPDSLRGNAVSLADPLGLAARPDDQPRRAAGAQAPERKLQTAAWPAGSLVSGEYRNAKKAAHDNRLVESRGLVLLTQDGPAAVTA